MPAQSQNAFSSTPSSSASTSSATPVQNIPTPANDRSDSKTQPLPDSVLSSPPMTTIAIPDSPSTQGALDYGMKTRIERYSLFISIESLP